MMCLEEIGGPQEYFQAVTNRWVGGAGKFGKLEQTEIDKIGVR